MYCASLQGKVLAVGCVLLALISRQFCPARLAVFSLLADFIPNDKQIWPFFPFAYSFSIGTCWVNLLKYLSFTSSSRFTHVSFDVKQISWFIYGYLILAISHSYKFKNICLESCKSTGMPNTIKWQILPGPLVDLFSHFILRMNHLYKYITIWEYPMP